MQTFQPPSHANLEVLKKVQKNMEIGTSNLEIFQNMHQIKKNNNRLFGWLFFYLFKWFCFALEFWTTSSHCEICACVRRLSFPRDLSAPMFHWNWNCTQVFSQISLINLAIMNKDYSIFLHSLRNFLAISKFSGSPWDLEAKLWDCEMASQTVSLTVKPWELEGLLMFNSKLWTPEIFLEWFFMLQWDLDILNEPLYNEVLAIANNFLYPSNNKIYEKEPWYNKTSLKWTNFVGPSALHYIEVLLYKERANQAWSGK